MPQTTSSHLRNVAIRGLSSHVDWYAHIDTLVASHGISPLLRRRVHLSHVRAAGLDYRHHRTGEDNADAHLKRTIMGHQIVLPITAGKLDLGPWEQVFYAEFDGRRRKRVVVKVMGEIAT